MVITVQAPLGTETKLLPSGVALAGSSNVVPRPQGC